MKTRILQEDDAAPDAREYFEKEFMKLIGIPFKEWWKKAENVSEDPGWMTVKKLDNISVEYAADEPYYTVYRYESVRSVREAWSRNGTEGYARFSINGKSIVLEGHAEVVKWVVGLIEDAAEDNIQM